MERIILHCDLNNFYASCELLTRPDLKNSPVVVGGAVDKRHGIVLAKNEIAKKAGIKTGDVMWQAKQKCPDIVVLPPNFDIYMKYSKQVFDIYSRYTSQVEAFGPDECWLDVSGSVKLFGDGKAIADTLREVIKKETKGLTVSAGVSFNKVFAKMASDLKKPDATSEITRDNFKEIVWKMPCRELFMTGKKTAEKLAHINIKTIGDLAAADERVLTNLLGINGLKLKKSALGLDDEPVREYVESRVPQSVGHGMTAVRDIVNYDDAGALIYYLADMVASRMRKNKLKGGGVSLSVRDINLETISKQKKLASFVSNSTEIGKTAIELLKSFWRCTPPIRTMTVSVYDLYDETADKQMTMFDEVTSDKNDNLDKALDKIRLKHGSDKIRRANLIERDFIYDKSDAEDFLPFKR